MDRIKYLLAAVLMVITLNAQAKVIAEMYNKGGGKIVITNDRCNDNKNYLAYATSNEIGTLMGCWAYDESFIHIRWYDGDLRSYPIEAWVLKEKIKGTL